MSRQHAQARSIETQNYLRCLSARFDYDTAIKSSRSGQALYGAGDPD